MVTRVTAGVKPPSSPGLRTPPPEACETPPKFRPVFQEYPGPAGFRQTQDQFFLLSRSAIAANLCSGGQLKLQLEGQVALGEAPVLQVVENSTLLQRTPVTGLSTVNVNVPKAGRIYLAYLNDYYQSEARVVWLEDLQLRGAGCSKLDVQVPGASGGLYQPAARAVYFLTAVPVTLRGCTSGTVSFKLRGQAAQGEFPVLKVSAAGLPDRLMRTQQEREYIELPLHAETLQLSVVNPYFKEVADRNLIIHSIRFEPSSRP